MINCNYCNKPARLTSGIDVYPHREDLASIKFWVCDPCGARVGCHKGTDSPLGTMANHELRTFRQQAHTAFDPKWRKTNKPRSKAYAWLAKKMRISTSNCHIGSFNIEQCKQVIRICQRP